MPPTKKSYGVICCRQSVDGVQIMMIKKSTTYHFCEFVAGHYRKHNESHLIKLFNNMTYYEKMDILSLKFQNMWYRIYRENPDNVFIQGNTNVWASSYLRKKNKFETTFLHDSGSRLKRLIANSSNVETEWEFPKGRKDHSDESDVETGIREFNEETGVRDDQYKILWNIQPYIMSYIDFGTKYQNQYYYASAIGKWEPDYKFYNKHQVSEVSAVQWLTKTDLAHMKLENIVFQRLTLCFSKVIKKFKSSKNNKSISSDILVTQRPTQINKTMTFANIVQNASNGISKSSSNNNDKNVTKVNSVKYNKYKNKQPQIIEQTTPSYISKS
jgi:8-oxo-dGTP pyrophosphatase MutT (NUDIX family)